MVIAMSIDAVDPPVAIVRPYGSAAASAEDGVRRPDAAREATSTLRTVAAVHTAAGDGLAVPGSTIAAVVTAGHIAVHGPDGGRWLVRIADRGGPDRAEAAPKPRLRVADATVREGDGRSEDGARGFFSTRGNRIVDEAGRPVRIAGVNWFGLESPTFAPHGLWSRGYREMMDQIAGLGFNTLRVPYSNALLDPGSAPNGIDFSKNPDLEGLSGPEILDKVVAYAGEVGLRVILDHHRSDAGTGVSYNGLWFDEAYPESRWIADWKALARRYRDNPTVIGADLHNEPHNGRWGGGGDTDWAAAAERAGNAVLSVNPDWLIIVEGVAVDEGRSYWWGGNLAGVARRPIRLSRPDKLVYSAHDYPNSIYAQTWFSDPRYPRNLPQKFTEFWGFIHKRGIAPVLIGEFGSRLEDPKDLQWLDVITAYLDGDLDADGKRDLKPGDLGFHWTWWSWNPNSTDTGGILADDWTTVIDAKVRRLAPLMFDWRDAGGTTAANKARFEVTLSRPAKTRVTVGYRTVAGTAGPKDFRPRSGKLVFLPGERKKTIAVPVVGDRRAEPDKRFRLELFGAKGASIARGTATGTIRDDD